MSKVLVDAQRLDLLIELADLSGMAILKNGIIKACVTTPCTSCVFFKNLNCRCDFIGYKYIIDWLKGD